MRRASRGTSLLELSLSLLLMGMLLTPILLTFRSSTATSLRGMRQIDLVLEAQRVLRQIHDDLESACTRLPAQSVQIRFDTLLRTVPSAVHAGGGYSFLRFPLNVPLTKAISADVTAGPAPRLANRITYTVEPIEPGQPGLMLVREEKPHPSLGGAPRKAILTRRLNFLRIAPVELRGTKGPAREFFQVTLQLLTTPDGRPPRVKPGENLLEPLETGLINADFFDVVCPEFYAALNNNPFNGRTWYTTIDGPD